MTKIVALGGSRQTLLAAALAADTVRRALREEEERRVSAYGDGENRPPDTFDVERLNRAEAKRARKAAKLLQAKVVFITDEVPATLPPHSGSTLLVRPKA